jgi:hypothetical protein
MKARISAGSNISRRPDQGQIIASMRGQPLCHVAITDTTAALVRRNDLTLVGIFADSLQKAGAHRLEQGICWMFPRRDSGHVTAARRDDLTLVGLAGRWA